MAGQEWRKLAAIAASVALASAAACRGGNGANDSATTATGDVAGADSAATAATPGMAGTPTSGAANTMTITGGDPEILNVLALVDQAEVQDGQLAQRQARNASVKSFARELVQSHNQSLQKDRRLAKGANIELTNTSTNTGRDSARSATDTSAAASNAGTSGNTGVSAQLQQMHTQTMERLRSLKGADFDSAFVNAEVMAHQQVLDLLQRSQNQAQNSDIQNHITDALKVVQTHLDRGRELQQKLTNSG